MAIVSILRTSQGTGTVGTSFAFSAINTTGGNTIVLALSLQGTTSAYSVSDTDGNTYTKLDEEAGSMRFVYFVAENITTSASNVITASWTGSGRITGAIDVYSGVNSYYGVLTGSSSFGETLSIDATPTSVDDLILLYIGGQGLNTITYGAGQTQIHNNTSNIADICGSEEIPTNTSLNPQTADAGFSSLVGGVLILQASTGGGGLVKNVKFNGVDIDGKINGVAIDKAYYNGTLVFEKT